MTEHMGLVLNKFEDGTAEVVTDRRDFCSGCADTRNCRRCLAGARRVVKMQNFVDANQGDVVSIYLEGSAMWTGALLAYIIPIMWLMIGAVIGSGLGADWKIGETGGAILLGIWGLALGFMIIFIISKSLKSGLRITPRILSVVERPEEGMRTFHMLETEPEQRIEIVLNPAD